MRLPLQFWCNFYSISSTHYLSSSLTKVTLPALDLDNSQLLVCRVPMLLTHGTGPAFRFPFFETFRAPETVDGDPFQWSLSSPRDTFDRQV